MARHMTAKHYQGIGEVIREERVNLTKSTDACAGVALNALDRVEQQLADFFASDSVKFDPLVFTESNRV